MCWLRATFTARGDIRPVTAKPNLSSATSGTIVGERRQNSLFQGSDGVLDGLERRELDILQLAIDLLDLAHVNVLHDVTRVRVDRDRPTRAFPLHALHRRYESVTVRASAGLLERLINDVHGVVAAHGYEIGPKAVRPPKFVHIIALFMGELWAAE